MANHMKTNPVWLIAKITFKEGIRNKFLHGIGLLSILLFISNLFITRFFAFETGKVAVDVGFSVLSLAGLSIIFFMGITLLSRDLHQKNICMIICHPLSRFSYVIGKFSGLALFMMIAFCLLGIFAVLSLWLGSLAEGGMENLRNFSWLMLACTIFFNFISLLMLLAVGFLLVTVTTSTYLSMMLTFLIYIIGHSLDTIILLLTKGEFVQATPLVLKTLKLASWILPNLNAFNLKTALSYGLPISSVYLSWLAVYGILYISVVLMATGIIMHFKDIK